MRATAAAIKRGDAISDKTPGIQQDLLKSINKRLLEQNRHEDRAVTNTIFYAVGRGGEVSTSIWDTTEWDTKQEQLLMDWPELKKRST